MLSLTAYTVVLPAIATITGVLYVILQRNLDREITTRLDRLPAAIARLATRGLPQEMRLERYAEWVGELAAITAENNGTPITGYVKRLLRALGFATDLIRGAIQLRRQPRSGPVRAAGGALGMSDVQRVALNLNVGDTVSGLGYLPGIPDVASVTSVQRDENNRVLYELDNGAILVGGLLDGERWVLVGTITAED